MARVAECRRTSLLRNNCCHLGEQRERDNLSGTKVLGRQLEAKAGSSWLAARSSNAYCARNRDPTDLVVYLARTVPDPHFLLEAAFNFIERFRFGPVVKRASNHYSLRGLVPGREAAR